MFRIVGSLPIRTRLPLEAWALAGLVALFSLVSSLMHMSVADTARPSLEQATDQVKSPDQARV
jgi:hypothetical protein